MRKVLFKYGSFAITLFLIFGLLTGCSTKEENSSGTNTSTGTNNLNNNSTESNYDSNDLSKLITSSGAITENGKLVVFVNNANKVAVDMEIEVEFYDVNGMILGSDSEELTAVGANSEIAVEMWSTPDSFDNYKIYVDVERTNHFSYFEELEIAHNNTGKEIVIQVKNNSNAVIEYITVRVVYYQGDKVVGIDDSIETDIKSGRSANFTLGYPYNKQYDDVRFDNYKIFVTEAYSYNWDW